MKAINSLVCIVLIVLLAPCLAHAQGVGASGDINGTVTDPTGAIIARANITAVETDRGSRHTSTSDDRGQYRITGLTPATYDVSAEIAGFSTEILKGVIVTVGSTTLADFHLRISTTKSTVEVSAQPPIVEVERGSQADTIVQQYISDLPISRRDYLTFTLLMPGVSDSTRLADDQDFRVKQTPQSGLSFYGSNGRGNSVTVDGGEANDDSGGVRLTLSQDAVQEFQINRSNYTADLGGASGASINIVSKSGTNQVHGSLFGYFRNDALDAQDPFAFTQAPVVPFSFASTGHPIKDSLNREQFGGSVGGPIRRDKTFLFASFEGLRQDAQNSVPILTNTSIFAGPAPVPSGNPFTTPGDPRAAQQSILSALVNNPGNPSVPCINKPDGTILFLPSQTCAGALAEGLTVSPTTGLSPIQTGLNNFLIGDFAGNGGLFDYNTREYLASVRLDHTFSDQNQVFLKYSFGHDLEESPDVQSLTGFTRGSSIHAYSHTLQGAWFHIFSPRTQNELRAQWNYTDFNVLPNQLGSVGLDIPGFGNFGNQIFIPSLTIMRRPDIADNFTKIFGHHTVKFGGEFLYRGNHTESHTFFPGRFVFGTLPGGALSPCFVASTAAMPVNPCGLMTSGAVINSLQSASLGVPQFYEQGFGNPIYNYPRPFTAFYVQDSWNMTSNFTLNFGLRYELDSQYGALNTDKDNFAPRVSFAWDPFKDHKTVIRGGFGIFYSPIYGQIADVVQTLGNVNGTRQIANFLAPANLPEPCALLGAPNPTAPFSGCIFQTLFNQGKVSCTSPAAGAAACITPADLAQFGINVTHTGPLPLLTVLFSGQRGYQNPYSEQASFGIEREIARGFSVSVSGIYSHTLRLPVAIDTNALPAAPFVSIPLAPLGSGKFARYRDWNSDPNSDPFGGAPCQGAAILTCFANPAILQADQYSSKGSALYEGAIVEVKKRFSDHFTLMGNYTYSKAFDTTTDFNSDFGPVDNTNLSAERGLSDFDQRHKFVFAAVVDSPWKNPILSGFQISPIVRYNSGHPFNLLSGLDINGDRHSTNDRTIGAARNTGLGPNYATWDMRVSRTFRLGERANLQLLAEGFNLTNRTNYASVNNVVGPVFGLPKELGGGGATTFNAHGQVCQTVSQPLCFTSAQTKRQIQLGARFSF